MSLVPVHGGLDAPVDRRLPLSRRKALAAEATSWPSIEVTEADLATVHRIADGTLSPLTGPMGREAVERVLAEKVIVREGVRYAWTIPTVLPVTDAEASALQAGARAALRGPGGELVGQLDVTEVFPWDKAAYVEGVYGTSRTDHPGGAIVTDDPRTMLVAGELWAFPPEPNSAYGDLVLTPLQTRALIASCGYERALAFQTRNPLHRAHEYALVYGAETLTRAGHYTGVFLNPLVGQLKNDDVDAATRMRCYRALRDGRLLGEGDADTALWADAGYSIHEVFHLVGLDIKMFYGGPAEAVMHAIYRQNHGFTDIVIGRKHADAPYFDKTPIWGDFDAQAIFDELGGALAIQPVKVGFAAYYDSLGRVDLMELHEGEKPFFISGTKVREILVSGERPDARILRPEIADILIDVYREQQAS
ncbi:MAG: sulfate adenylyltransferase [Alphaproteobacteria bacterium]|nr:sulfate adenylyltransferase [Alphaproteobacteria bacterium]